MGDIRAKLLAAVVAIVGGLWLVRSLPAPGDPTTLARGLMFQLMPWALLIVTVTGVIGLLLLTTHWTHDLGRVWITGSVVALVGLVVVVPIMILVVLPNASGIARALPSPSPIASPHR